MSLIFDEEFKSCFPYNNSLKVSQYGRVMDIKGNILEQTVFNKYLTVIDPRNKYPFEYVHRLVALIWLKDDYKNGLHVHHKDNNGFNNRIDNLEWISNVKHAQAHDWQEIDEFGSWIRGL